MKVLRFFQEQHKGNPFIKLYLRQGSQNYGPASLPVPHVFYTSTGIPIKSEEHNFESIVNQLFADLVALNHTNPVQELPYAFRKFPFNTVRNNLHIIVNGNPSDITEIIDTKYYKKFFNKEPLSYTDWLRYYYDWDKDLIFDSNIMEALVHQSHAHNYLDIMFQEFLFDQHVKIQTINRELATLAATSDQFIEHFSSNGGSVPPNIKNLLEQRSMERKRYAAQKSKIRRFVMGNNVDLPSNVIDIMHGFVEEYNLLTELIKPFDGDAELNLKILNVSLRLNGYSVLNLWPNGDTKVNWTHGTYDTETSGYKFSSEDPSGLSRKIWLAALRSDGLSVTPGLEIPSNILELSKYSDILVGTLNIEGDQIFSDTFSRTAFYLHQPDDPSLRYITGKIIRLKNLHSIGGHNLDGHDLAVSANPLRSDEVVADLSPQLPRYIKTLFMDPDGMFMPGCDLSQPTFYSKSWLPSFNSVPIGIDTLHIARHYLSPLMLDHTLVSHLAAFAFYHNLNLEYNKLIQGYTQLEELRITAKNDPQTAKTVIQYGYEDTITQHEAEKIYLRVFDDISSITGILEDTIIRLGPKALANLILDREFAQKRGLILTAQEHNPYLTFDINSSKVKSLKSAFGRVYGQAPKSEHGVFSNIDVFYTPFFSEACNQVIKRVPILAQLSQLRLSSQNLFASVIYQNLLDNLLSHVMVDSILTKNGSLWDSELYHRYGISSRSMQNYQLFFKEYAHEMDKIVTLLDSAPINCTGNLLFVNHDNSLIDKLVGRNFIYLGTGDLISLSSGRVIYGVRENGKLHVANDGFKMLSQHKIDSPDKTFKGYDPNFYDDLICKLAFAQFEQGQEGARNILKEFVNNYWNLSAQNFFITLKGGMKLEHYTERYQDTARYQLLDLLNLQKGQSKVVVLELENGSNLIPRIVDTSDTKGWSNLNPYKPYYRDWAFAKNRNLYQLCNRLGIAEELDYLVIS